MNSNTQNTKIAAITEKTLIIGIDVGSETHFARAFDWRSFEYSKEPLAFKNTEDGFQRFRNWTEDIMKKHGKTAVITGMEPTGHYWFNLGAFLQDSGYRLVHVNPHHVKKSKEMDDNNPSKNDRKDPKVIAALVNEGRYICPYIPRDLYAEIRNLSNLRVQAQEELTKIRNRLARWFSINFPEYKDVYGKSDAKSGILVLKTAPLPADIVKLGAEGVNRIWRDAKFKAVGMKRAETLVKAAEHSVGSSSAPETARYELKTLLEDYERYSARMSEIISRLDGQLSKVSYVDKVLEIKGIGMNTVSGFVAEAGDLSRFKSPKELQKLAGLAVVSCDSGKHKGESHISYRGRKRLRYVLYEAAVSLIARNEAFKEIYRYYTTRDVNPLKKMQALIVVACKLLRVMYTILRKGCSFDEEKLLADIVRPQAA